MRESLAWLVGFVLGWVARRSWGFYRVKRYFEERRVAQEKRERESLTPTPWEKKRPPE